MEYTKQVEQLKHDLMELLRIAILIFGGGALFVVGVLMVFIAFGIALELSPVVGQGIRLAVACVDPFNSTLPR